MSSINNSTLSISSMRATALITGATGGLGKAFAVECASRGWDVYLTDLNAHALCSLAEGLRNTYGINANTFACDLTDPDSRAQLFDDLRKRNLLFHFLVNVAGTDYEGAFHDRTQREIRTILRLNIEGTLEMIHALLTYRSPGAPFRIINVASLAAFYPMPIKATYAASKRFLLDFSLALREELRSQDVSVTALCPGGLYTNPECIQAIEAQGLAGHLTAQNIGSVAAATLDSALLGKAVYIPGFFNRALQLLGALLPPTVVAAFIGYRWRSVQQKRSPVSTGAAP